MNKWTARTGEFRALHESLARIAEENGLTLNPDEERVEKVVGLMTENVAEFGKRYCPCKQSHPLAPEKDVLCPCPTWKSEIADDGHCFCRLFYAESA